MTNQDKLRFLFRKNANVYAGECDCMCMSESSFILLIQEIQTKNETLISIDLS